MPKTMMDAYVKIENIAGEAQADGFKQWIQITDYKHSVRQGVSSTRSSAGSQATGRVDVGQIRFEKLVDAATPQLMASCCDGQHIGDIEFVFTRAGGSQQNKYYSVKLKDSLISEVTQHARAHGDDEVMTEEVVLYFRTIEWEYTQTSQTGGGISGAQAAGWDAASNTLL